MTAKKIIITITTAATIKFVFDPLIISGKLGNIPSLAAGIVVVAATGAVVVTLAGNVVNTVVKVVVVVLPEIPPPAPPAPPPLIVVVVDDAELTVTETVFVTESALVGDIKIDKVCAPIVAELDAAIVQDIPELCPPEMSEGEQPEEILKSEGETVIVPNLAVVSPLF
jgi:hypothetical protein